MSLSFDERPSDSPLVGRIWRSHSEHDGSFSSIAAPYWEIVVTKYKGRTTMTIRGPETKATPMDFSVGTEWFGIDFKLGTFMPHLPPARVMDLNDFNLPEAPGQSFWLCGSAWQFPNYENADTFVDRLAREGLLVRDAVVEAATKGQPQALSPRAVQYRFVQSTGLTQQTIRQIERARHAAARLKQGVSILDTVYEAGYSDQPHLTRALKRFIGHTPAQITDTPIISLGQSE
jgi:hypothetical protein